MEKPLLAATGPQMLGKLSGLVARLRRASDDAKRRDGKSHMNARALSVSPFCVVAGRPQGGRQAHQLAAPWNYVISMVNALRQVL